MTSFPVLITEALTGHTHYGSPYECFDNCGTCDGACCYRCEKVLWVENLETGQRRSCKTEEEAMKLAAEWEAALTK